MNRAARIFLRDQQQASPAQQTFLRHYFLWGLGVRLIIWAAFQWNAQMLPAGVFAISSAVFLIAMPLLWAKRWNWLVVILGLEWAHLSIRLTVCYGWDSGFHLYLLLLTVVTLIFDHIPIRLRVLMALLPMAAFAVRFGFLISQPPAIRLATEVVHGLYLANALVFIASAMLMVLHFIHTALVQKARAEALAESRAELIANMSHELKTPLAAMLMTAQSTLKRAQNEGDYRDAIALWERNTREMSHLVNRMLDLVAADAGEVKPQIRDVDLKSVLDAIVQSVGILAAQKNASVGLEGVGSMKVRTDPDFVTIILNNLVSNALRYCREGGRVRIQAGTDAGTNNGCFVAVSDDGPGISPEDLPHIFDPFYRADRSRSRSEGAKGLGLAIASRFAEALGGRIEVRSEPGKGATFTLRCPT